MLFRKLGIAFFLLFPFFYALAEGVQISLVGVFSDRAYLKINGERVMLRPGQEGPAGVRLIEASGHGPWCGQMAKNEPSTSALTVKALSRKTHPNPFERRE